MFNLSTQEVVLSIEKSPLLVKQGIVFQEYQNFFGKEYVLQIDRKENFEKLENQTDKNRVKLNDQDIDMRKLKIFFMNTKLTKALGEKFGTELKFDSVDVWIDGKGYSLSPHVDDKRIKLHLQVYLTDNSVGTSLYGNNNKKIHTFKFVRNKGYALLNNQYSVHGVDEVSQDGRMSLYARYS